MSLNMSVAIVTPVYRLPLSADEELSLKQLRTHLGAYRRILIAPTGLALHGLADFEIRRFPARFFRSVQGYNHLLLSRKFYRAFDDFEWMLIYQLDSLVLRDDLARWCGMHYDYIGAPIVVPVHWAGAVHGLNGGFSLRRIRAFRRVLAGGQPERRKIAADGMVFMQKSATLRLAKQFLIWAHLHGLANVVPLLVLRSGYPEDLFWSNFAPLLDGNFKVTPKHEAKEFALETEPRHLFEQLGGQFPFGCHAWQKHDPQFWRTLLRKHQILGSES